MIKKKIIDRYNSLYKFEYEDWFTRNIPIWDYIFDSYNLRDKEIDYLEIGSYEGRSSLFILELLQKTNCEFVDPYIDYAATPTFSAKQMNEIYNNFKKKIEKFSHRTKIYKTSSVEFFANNKKKYDLIYIDGSHYGPDVEKDLISSYEVLNKDGIIILDDLLWNHYKQIDQNPVGGIIPFVKENFDKLKVITVGDQLILQKKIAVFI
ncbi:class I SAM-dependent methyltransferase [Pelagibacteraceae bacterium]|jgi:predicted O-methyltransferase YrrM|nr:class I SAM-dependent methyltransferase [Pelagibacteraceae bacterium]